MTFVIDLDKHILYTEKIKCKRCGEFTYKVIDIDREEISLINKAYNKGHKIILYTGRSWGFYDLTVNQLEYYNVLYNDLVMGKPVGTYIDKEAKFSLKGLL